MQLNVSVSITLRDDKYRADTRWEQSTRFKETCLILRRPLKPPNTTVTLHVVSCFLWRDWNTFTAKPSDAVFITIKRQFNAGVSGRELLRGACLKRHKWARNQARSSRRKCPPNRKQLFHWSFTLMDRIYASIWRMSGGVFWEVCQSSGCFQTLFILVVMTTSLRYHANWELLTLCVITVKISFRSLHSLTTK